jgi:methionyl-tRNA formyltransferase
MVKAIDGKENVLKIYRTTKTDIPSTNPIGEMVIDRKHLYFACSDYLLQIDELQMAGKKRMDAQSFINGLRKQ